MKCPPPRYLTREELLEELPVDKNVIFKLTGMEETPEGGLICTDKDVIDK